MNRKKKVAAVALAALMACGTLAGCDALTTVNSTKNYAQVIAEVDLTKADEFKENGSFYAYKDLVSPAEISKRDLIALYYTSGYTLQQQNGMSYTDTFNTLVEYLVNRQVAVQYAMVCLVSSEDGDADGNKYTVQGYTAAVTAAGADATDTDKRLAGLKYFLTANDGTDEKAKKAEYDLKSFINGSIDSIEESIIDFEEDEHDHTPDSEVRTTPTGAETENDEFYDEEYNIYTGRESDAQLGTYEMVDGSTRTTRKKAYNRFLSSLMSNGLLTKGEDTTNFASLSYYKTQLLSRYETAVLEKLTDKFEQKATQEITEAWATKEYADNLADQKVSYGKDKSAFETAFDALSDSTFVLTPYDANYGYVINILLPFSTRQSALLTEASNDFGDAKGNKFAARAQLLKEVLATDQRGTWFTGHTDYSFDADAKTAYNGGNADRTKLFFENSFPEDENGQYERLANYYGDYTFNGVAVKDEDGDGYEITPNKISIDGFLEEMHGYLDHAGLGVTVGDKYTEAYKQAYFNEDSYYYTEDVTDEDGTAHKKGEVDYGKFVYEMGKITSFKGDAVFGEAAPYNANELFLKDSAENTALSVINELSFAYNTDTAGLNTYLGYMVSPFKTSFVSEFEYAAQLAVRGGAGTYTVVPSDYGWHIIYCTFSFADSAGKDSPYDFVWDDIEKEGTFSYRYYESLKSTTVANFASNMQTEAIIPFLEACSTVYEERFADLLNLD